MKALVVVDIQNDFVPGGALPVPRGNEIVSSVNRLQQLFELVVATQDWHPPNHGSFAVNHPSQKPGDKIMLNGLPQILWPVHCVQDSPGAAFVPGLDTSRFRSVFRKATDPGIDSYSGFFDNGHRKETGLREYLHQRGIQDVYIAGLATDYCVRFTAIDAVALGFKAYVIQDACRGMDLNPGDVDRALHEMRQAGVNLIHSK